MSQVNVGIELEEEICSALNLEQIGDGHENGYYDAVDPWGAPIEIKSCKHRYPNGEHGRFTIYRDQHEALLTQRDAKYLLVIHDQGELQTWKVLTAQNVDELIPHWTSSVSQRNNPDEQYKLTWTKAFPNRSFHIERERERHFQEGLIDAS